MVDAAVSLEVSLEVVHRTCRSEAHCRCIVAVDEQTRVHHHRIDRIELVHIEVTQKNIRLLSAHHLDSLHHEQS